MAAPTVRSGVSTGTMTSATSWSVPPPSTIVNGDMLIMVVAIDAGYTGTPPTGWHALYQAVDDYGKQQVFWKTAASESGNYTVSYTGSVGGCYCVMAISGAIPGFQDVWTHVKPGTGATTASCPTTSTNFANELVIQTCSDGYNCTIIGLGGSYAEQCNQHLSGSASLAVDTITQAAAGSTAGGTWGLGASRQPVVGTITLVGTAQQVRSDSFDRTNSATSLGTPSDGGGGWSNSAGTWGISSNQAYLSVSGERDYAWLDSALTDHVFVAARINAVTPEWGLCGKVASGSNLCLLRWTGSAFQLFNNLSGLSQIGSNISATGGTVGVGDIIGLLFSGGNVSVFQNGTQLNTPVAYDSSLTSNTNYGLAANVNTAVRFDDFAILTTAAVASFTVSPGGIPVSHSGNITLSLTGSGTSWTSGSSVSITNSVSGTTTVTAGTWTANSGTSATLVVTTGAGSGTFKITVDGVASPAVTVGTPSFTVSPTSGSLNIATSVTATGTNTAWADDHPAFTISGTGNSISGQSWAAQGTSAFTVNAGSSTGSFTITDPSTGATASFSLTTPPAVTAWTATQAGNWTRASNYTDSPWYDNGNQTANGRYPGSSSNANGDTVTINTCKVTLDNNVTIGTGPNDQTTMVLSIGGTTGKLVLGAGNTLTVNGNIYANAGTTSSPANGIEWQAGSGLVFGTHNVTGGWVLKGGVWNIFYARGSSGSHAVLQTASGTTTQACCTQANVNGGPGWDAQWLDVSRMGSSSTSAVVTTNAYKTNQGCRIFSFLDSTFDTCGQIYSNYQGIADAGNGGTQVLQRCTVTNSLATASVAIVGPPSQVGITGGTLLVTDNNVFSGLVTINPGAGFTVNNNICLGGLYAASIPVVTNINNITASFHNNFIRTPTTSQRSAAYADDCYFFADSDTTGFTVHGISATGRPCGFHNCIAEWAGNTVDGNVAYSITSDALCATITGAANNGSGAIRIATSAAHGYTTGDQIAIFNVLGTVEANNVNRANPAWTITVIDSTHFDLNGSTFTNAYSAGVTPTAVRVTEYHAVTGTANNGSGLIRITTAANRFVSGDTVTISGVTGTTEANGTWTITVIDSTHFDLVGSTFANAWISGGGVVRPNINCSITNCVNLPSPACAQFGLFTTTDTSPYPTGAVVEHNTLCGTAHNSSIDIGAICFGDGGGTGVVGSFATIRSNLSWSTKQSGSPAGMYNDGLAYPGWLVTRWHGLRSDWVYAEKADYNWIYNGKADTASGSNLYGYVIQQPEFAVPIFSSGTPDAHGAIGNAVYQGDPQFSDVLRTLPLFDTKYLGTTASKGTWATSTGYVVGDVVSLGQSGVYDGTVVNYRCILAHTSGSSSKPGNGASWRTYWEWNTLAQIRANTGNVALLKAWVRAGYTPQNPATATAGHDGATVGAFVFGGASPPGASPPLGIISGGCISGIKAGILTGGRM